ncbi:MAG: transposase [Burkholderiales bacterium RIFCSPHIGHO2_12_FULL_69_20]|nr:MAG: transposase [Burkholderiales bacterium RIFCSPHIGHO2_12_FULL_69_20]
MQYSPAGTPPLTRVSLAYVHQRFNLYLRFGQPERTLQLDHWRRCAIFKPSAVFCRVRWQANDQGTTLWQLMVLQAGTPLDTMQRLPGVRPGARVLLHVEGELKVRAVLQQIDVIEAQGIDACTVAAAYWGTLGNRLAAWTSGPSVAPLQLPTFTADRHAAALAARDLP